MPKKTFTLQVEQSVLDDLKERLARTRWPDEPAHAEWNMGTNTSYLKELVEYWQNSYDWRKHEAYINTFPQYMVSIDGKDIHFAYIKSNNPNAKPMLLLHGWPDSFYRFHKIIPMFTDPEAYGGKAGDAFDVIVPSLPGFGFSTHDTVSSTAAADLFAKLMAEELGHSKYLVAAGDQGSRVARAMAVQHPEAVVAVHLTDAGYPTGQEDPSTMTKSEQEFAKFIQGWWATQGAYAMVHNTKPQSLAPALNDSPAGLASWMLSFIDTGADNHDVESAVGSRDELLTLVTINWVAQNAGPAMRAYLLDAWEMYKQPGGPKPEPKGEVPTALLVFPREAPTPEDWARRTVNLQRYQKAKKGGHFAAMEVPDIYVDDIRAFFADYQV